MDLPGELKGLDGTKCFCGEKLELDVCMSGAGSYLGYRCNKCGPFSRETGYFLTEIQARAALFNYQTHKTVPDNVRDSQFRG